MPTTDAPRTARQIAREELTRSILNGARRQLGEVGASDLSLRAVARDLGMASSAVYRYVASRDELLTLLIIDTYDEIGEVAERADSELTTGRNSNTDTSARQRWTTVCTAIRDWALAHPNEWALVYGSPVVGYAAPQDTIEPATRATRVMGRIVIDAMDNDELSAPSQPLAGPQPVEPKVIEMISGTGDDQLPDLTMRALTAWTVLVGAISLELFEHLNNVVTDRDAWFAGAIRLASDMIGLRPLA